MLSKLLSEMDGLREDAAILFILTTNRPDRLEAALASRPGHWPSNWVSSARWKWATIARALLCLRASVGRKRCGNNLSAERMKPAPLSSSLCEEQLSSIFKQHPWTATCGRKCCPARDVV